MCVSDDQINVIRERERERERERKRVIKMSVTSILLHYRHYKSIKLIKSTTRSLVSSYKI